MDAIKHKKGSLEYFITWIAMTQTFYPIWYEIVYSLQQCHIMPMAPWSNQHLTTLTWWNQCSNCSKTSLSARSLERSLWHTNHCVGIRQWPDIQELIARRVSQKTYACAETNFPLASWFFDSYTKFPNIWHVGVIVSCQIPLKLLTQELLA